MTIATVSAHTRFLADYRFGEERQPSLASHADVGDWSMPDAVAVWHAYRYGVQGVGPEGSGRGFTLYDFQNRDLSVDMTIAVAAGPGKDASMRESIPIFQRYIP